MKHYRGENDKRGAKKGGTRGKEESQRLDEEKGVSFLELESWI